MYCCALSTRRYPVDHGPLETEVLEKVFMDLVKYHAYILQDTFTARKNKLRVRRAGVVSCRLALSLLLSLPVLRCRR